MRKEVSEDYGQSCGWLVVVEADLLGSVLLVVEGEDGPRDVVRFRVIQSPPWGGDQAVANEEGGATQACLGTAVAGGGQALGWVQEPAEANDGA